MPLIGVIAKKKNIKIIKKYIIGDKLQLIEINNKSTDNLKNIKFDEIVILENITLDRDKYKYINDIISKTDYLIVNDSVNLNEIKIEKPIKIITIGFNSKSTITISSIGENKIILSVQREIKKKNNDVIEAQEKVLDIVDGVNIYNEIVVFIINELHN